MMAGCLSLGFFFILLAIVDATTVAPKLLTCVAASFGLPLRICSFFRLKTRVYIAIGGWPPIWASTTLGSPISIYVALGIMPLIWICVVVGELLPC